MPRHWTRRVAPAAALLALHALCFAAFPTQRGRASQISQLRAVGLQEMVIQPVTDFAGNGTAFVLPDTVLPNVAPPQTRRFDVPGFSPGAYVATAHDTNNNGNMEASFVVDGVISKEDCEKVVQISEDIGFRTRWSQVGAVTLFMPEDFSNRIFERLKPFLPDHFGGRPIGIHRRWAVLKYQKGQYLNPHIDGHTPGTVLAGDGLQKDAGTRSYMTCLFWLNDEVEGGETVFTYPQGGIWVAIPPKRGGALLFYHAQNAINNPMHYGGDVKSGVKYLVRSDIIYKA